jgi:hypothetical protein
MSIPSSCFRSSPARCGELPVPGVEYEYWPGFAFARSINSFSDFAGMEGCTARMKGADASSATGAKSRFKSNGALAYADWLIAADAVTASSV